MAAEILPSSFPVLLDPDRGRCYRKLVEDAKTQFAAAHRSCLDSIARTAEEIPKWEARRAEFDSQQHPAKAELDKELAPKHAFYACHRSVRDLALQTKELIVEVLSQLLPQSGEPPFAPCRRTLLILQNLKAVDIPRARSAIHDIFIVQANILQAQKDLMQLRHRTLGAQLLRLKLAIEPLDKAASADQRPALPAVVNDTIGRAPYVDAALSRAIPAGPEQYGAATAATPPPKPQISPQPSSRGSPQRPSSAPSRAAEAAAANEMEGCECCLSDIEPPTPAHFYTTKTERTCLIYNNYGAYSQAARRIEAMTASPEDYTAKRDEYIQHKRTLAEIRKAIRAYNNTLGYLMPDGTPPTLDRNTLLLLQNLEVVDLSATQRLYGTVFTQSVKDMRAQKQALEELEREMDASLKTAAAKLEPLAPRVPIKGSVGSLVDWFWNGAATPCLDADVRIRELEMTACS